MTLFLTTCKNFFHCIVTCILILGTSEESIRRQHVDFCSIRSLPPTPLFVILCYKLTTSSRGSSMERVLYTHFQLILQSILYNTDRFLLKFGRLFLRSLTWVAYLVMKYFLTTQICWLKKLCLFLVQNVQSAVLLRFFYSFSYTLKYLRNGTWLYLVNYYAKVD